MSGRRSFWTTREGVVLIIAGLVFAGLVFWGISSLINETTTPRTPAKKNSDQPKQPRPEPLPPNPPIDPGNP